MTGAARVLCLGVVCLAACDKPFENGYAVDLVVVSDGTVTDEELHTVKTLAFVVTGAETANATYQLDRPFANGQERVVYRPATEGGNVTIEVTARAADASVLAAGRDAVALELGKTVARTIKVSRAGN